MSAPRYFKHFTFVILTLIFVFVIFIKFLWLDKFPVGIYHDEIEYVLSAKSYSLNGTDLSGIGFPLSLFKTETDGKISPIPALILSPFTTIIKLDQANVRIPAVIINLLTAICIGFFIFFLSKNHYAALTGSLIFLINPWSFYLSRYMADSPFALLFFILAIVIFLNQKGKRIWLGLVFFVLGFFSYHAAKLLFLPVTGLLVIYKLIHGSDNFKSKSALIFFSAAALFFFCFFTISFFIPNSIQNSRADDLIFSKEETVKDQVDEQRRLTITNVVSPIFSNKYTAIFKVFVSKYLTAFSPDVLFLSGDQRATYRFGEHGLLFLVDGFMIFFGLFYLYKKDKKKLFLIVSLLLIAPFPTAISAVETSVINRSFLLLPMFIILSALGIFELSQIASVYSKKIKIVVIFSIFVIYLISYSNFLHFYLYRYPLTQQESYFLSERILANYLAKSTDSKTVVILPKETIARSVFLEYVFYSKLTNEEFIKVLEKLGQNNYSYGNLIFTSNCFEKNEPDLQIIISRESTKCSIKQKENQAIKDQKDSGSIFKIINGLKCQNILLSSFRREHLLNLYNIEILSEQSFCQNWINSP